MGKAAKPMKPLTEADLKAARRSWNKLLDLEPGPSPTAVALWASVWAEPLMRAAEDQVRREPPDPDT
jgi:hypothetical protein